MILKDNPTLNIHAEYDYAFRLACQSGYLDIARWLIDLSKDTETFGGPIDIHACSDDAFLSAYYYYYGHLHIARWLIPFGGMPAMALKKHHPIRKFYLNRFPAIGLLSLHFRRYLREIMYSPGGRGYVFAKKRFKGHSEHLGVSESPAQSCR